MIISTTNMQALRRSSSVERDLRARLDHALRQLPTARTEQARREVLGRIRVFKLALQDLQRQKAVNPLFVPGDRPGDSSQYAAPVDMPGLPLMPGALRALSPMSVRDSAISTASAKPRSGASVISAQNDSYTTQSAPAPAKGSDWSWLWWVGGAALAWRVLR